MVSTRILLIASVLCFLLVLAVPTAALTVGEDPMSDDIVLEPVDNRYATIDDGKLVLDLSLYDNAVSTVTDVFTIEVSEDADDVEALWIDHDVDGVSFYGDGAKLTNESRLEPIPGETITVGATVNTHVTQTGTERFTVAVQYDDEEDAPSPDIERTELNVSPTTVDTGEPLTATATYRNVGSASSETTAELTVDGTVVDQRTIDLEPGEERTVTFERPMYWPDTYEVGITGAGSESVTIGGPPIDIVNASVDSTTVTTGDSTTVRATVRNPTDRAVDRTLEVAVDGIVVDSQAVSIPANGERTVTFERQFETAGTYEIAVSGVPAGKVSVEDPVGMSLQNRELAAATTAALAPPATAGLLFLAGAANRRWAIVR
ncbi:CARDB domain-containing protein [Haloarchaeobius amylolyticus]|uniref:CARDB domain-containing protein n=1 Tax=Haloarchaeobius amylolyticus TaxID=1198296 RepID=A0ABD6BE41_9EURY